MSERKRKINLNNPLAVKNDFCSSRFVVDLKKEREERQEKSPNLISEKEEFFFLSLCRARARNLFARIKEIWNRYNRGWREFYVHYLKPLAIFALLEAAGRLFLRAGKGFFYLVYFISYFLGWSFLFVLRLIYLLLKEIGIKLLAILTYLAAGLPVIGEMLSRQVKNIFRFLFWPWLKIKNLILSIGRGAKEKFFLWRAQKQQAREERRREGEWKAEEKETKRLAEKKLEAVQTAIAYNSGPDGEETEEETEPAESYEKSPFFTFRRWRRAAGFLLILFLVIALPLKIVSYLGQSDLLNLPGRVLGVSESAVADLFLAKNSLEGLDFSSASERFSQAAEKFSQANGELKEINSFLFQLAKLWPQEKIRQAGEGKNVLAAAEAGARAGENLSLAMAALFNKENKDLITGLKVFSERGKMAEEEIEKLNKEILSLDAENLPAEIKPVFPGLKEKSLSLAQSFKEFLDLTGELTAVLGSQESRKYLLVFQNNAEARASGGFIGSFAVVDIGGGKIKSITTPGGGSYDTEGGLTAIVEAPEPLHLVNTRWYFWDANWWPDWPTSAKKLMWFYEKSDGPTVDGVISFTPTVMEKLLKIIGPLDLREKYGVVINEKNFWLTAQELAEQETKDNKPKKIIGDMLALIMEELPKRLDQKKMMSLAGLIEDSLKEKQILLYFNDEELNQKISARGWDGRINDTPWDYLSVVNTNIAGGKSDRKIEETISHAAEVLEDGTIIDTVKIERRHTAKPGERFTGVRNVDWLRVYVPAGSELLEAEGFRPPDKIYFQEEEIAGEQDPLIYRAETAAFTHEPSGTKIYQEFNKTVFANWSMADPGETIELRLKYRLPFKLTAPAEKGLLRKAAAALAALFGQKSNSLSPYGLLAQKQAGASPAVFNSSLTLPQNYRINQYYPSNLNILADGWQIKDELNQDKYWTVLVDKEEK